MHSYVRLYLSLALTAIHKLVFFYAPVLQLLFLCLFSSFCLFDFDFWLQSLTWSHPWSHQLGHYQNHCQGKRFFSKSRDWMESWEGYCCPLFLGSHGPLFWHPIYDINFFFYNWFSAVDVTKVTAVCSFTEIQILSYCQHFKVCSNPNNLFMYTSLWHIFANVHRLSEFM